MKRKKRILMAMSGGIDSSLAAALLKKKGHEVIGLTMKLWPEEDCGRYENAKACCSLSGIEDARHTADKLGIPHYVFDFHREFKREVIDYFCEGYVKGSTPNPCIVCNQRIKFDLLLKKARALDCGYIATGHYAKVRYNRSSRRYFIEEGRDKEKDQSYFLSFVSQAALAKTIFPLANMAKAESRRLARQMRLKVHDKTSSQEVCFVREHYSEYIRNWGKADLKEGDILNSKGKMIGRHKGIHFYTIGQRKGLGIAYKEPLYVIKIHRDKNVIIAGTKTEALKRVIVARDPHWSLHKNISKHMRVTCKIRYAHKKAPALVEKIRNGKLRISFDRPQLAPTPGQAAVFYRGGKMLGGSWIEEVVE